MASANEREPVDNPSLESVTQDPPITKAAQPRAFDFKKTVRKSEFESAREIVRVYNIQAILNHIPFLEFLRMQDASKRLMKSVTIFLQSKIDSGQIFYQDIEEVPVMFFVDRFDVVELLRQYGFGRKQL